MVIFWGPSEVMRPTTVIGSQRSGRKRGSRLEADIGVDQPRKGRAGHIDGIAAALQKPFAQRRRDGGDRRTVDRVPATLEQTGLNTAGVEFGADR